MKARKLSTFFAAAALSAAVLAPCAASARYRTMSGTSGRQEVSWGWLHFHMDYMGTSEFNDATVNYIEVDVRTAPSPAVGQVCAQACRDSYWAVGSYCSAWACNSQVTNRTALMPSVTEWKNGSVADYRWVEMATTDTSGSTHPLGFYVANSDQ